MLERGGLIVRGREAQWRPCRIDTSALREVDDWLVRYRGLWEARLDRLGEYLQELQRKQDRRAGKKRKRTFAPVRKPTPRTSAGSARVRW